ncbi:zinc ribbon domain-containing protein [Bacillus sp. FJAT-49736]|uniref:zinc ribbon domain-containing protein n=1 Tax=Bacillus sp. FJAT-49736 TaxID=2833582 RepID=UPI001BC99DB1|nr:zinc ribbon domain-containing protein [Bacillus sp. FJAT-49736]MBS4173381.1 zinc ribbon domain-containing protein [Bacillus sp. FJAT-49736]
MNCPNCQHENKGGNFCEHCGASLLSLGASEAAAAHSSTTTVPSKNAQPNQYVEATKKISQQYFQFITQVLKKPFGSSREVGEEHFVNGIITIILYSLFLPLILFFAVKGLMSEVSSLGSLFGARIDASPSFWESVALPFIGFIILTLLVITFTFGAIKLGRVQIGYKEVLARFSAFLIPFVAVLIIALLLAISKIQFSFYIFLLGFLGSIMMIPPLVIASYKKDNHEGFDVIYGSLATYVLTFISIYIMGDMLFKVFKSALSNMFGGFLGL